MAPRIFMCYVKECQPLDWRHSDFNLGEWNPSFSWLEDWMSCTAGLDSAGQVTFLVGAGNVTPYLVTVLTELLWIYKICKVQWSQQMIQEHNTIQHTTTQHVFWDVKRQEHVSATTGSHAQDVHRQWKGNIYRYISRFDIACSCVLTCCVVLCCVVVCCFVLYCSVLCRVVSCLAVLYCAVLCCIVLWCVVFCCTVFCCVVLCCIVLCWIVWCCYSTAEDNWDESPKNYRMYNSLSSAVGPNRRLTDRKSGQKKLCRAVCVSVLVECEMPLNVIESTVCWPTVCQLTY